MPNPSFSKLSQNGMKIRNGIKENGALLKKEFRERTATYVIAGFGLVAGLAWNDAIKTLIAVLFPLRQDTILVKFLYAFLVTILLVVVSIPLIQLMQRNDQKPQG